MVITAKQLVEKGACDDQVALFRKVFGTKARVTTKNVEIAPLLNFLCTIFVQTVD